MKEKMIKVGQWSLFALLASGIATLGLSSVATWKKLAELEMKILSDNEAMAASVERIGGDIFNLRSELKERG